MILGGHRQLDLPALVGELGGIGQQICQDLSHACNVGFQPNGLRREGDGQLEFPSGDGRPSQF
jgi:hypothetical protein